MHWTDFIVPGKDYEATAISAMWGRRMAMDEFERDAYEQLGRRYEGAIRLHLSFKNYRGASAEGINASLEDL